MKQVAITIRFEEEVTTLVEIPDTINPDEIDAESLLSAYAEQNTYYWNFERGDLFNPQIVKIANRDDVEFDNASGSGFRLNDNTWVADFLD